MSKSQLHYSITNKNIEEKENTTDENKQFNNYIKLFKTQLSQKFVSPYSGVPVETFPLNHKTSCYVSVWTMGV